MSYSDKDIYPKEVKYFKEDLISEVFTISEQKPDIYKIIDVILSPEIVNTKLINTTIGRSNEGQYLSGYKLVVDIKLKHKITYICSNNQEEIYYSYHEIMKGLFVILPETFNDTDVCNLVRADRIQVTPYIETNKSNILDPKTIFSCTLLFLNITLF